MSLEGKTLKVCSCNKTLALDAKALAEALKLGAPLAVHHELCRKDAGAYQAALRRQQDPAALGLVVHEPHSARQVRARIGRNGGDGVAHPLP